MPLKPEVLERLLLSKSFLEKIRFQPVAIHDRHTIALNIISSHDAAELAIAAICDQLGCLPQKGTSYLMDYFAPLKDKLQLTTDVHGKDYFRNLNNTRALLKHQGLYPDARQWSRVGETVFQHLGNWCLDYLQIQFSDLDESALIHDTSVKELYDEACNHAAHAEYKTALEKLSLALTNVFADNAALTDFEAGKPRTEDTIRLANYGVHTNDFLALQQFLPHVPRWTDRPLVPVWNQSQFGHPGNWHEVNIDFCLRAFVDVVVKIQGAQWVPGPLSRASLYELQIEALKDKVELWRYENKLSKETGFGGIFAAPPKPEDLEKKIVLILNRGDKMRAIVSLATEAPDPKRPLDSFALALGGPKKSKVVLDVFSSKGYGQVLLSDVRVMCVPRTDDFIQQYFSWLPEFEWDPE
jgi:hypothetical protein